MAEALLLRFYGVNRVKPERIILFRDGVSDGEFDMVLNTEVPKLQEAFSRLGDGSYRPLLTVVVCKKRHATRLFPAAAAADDGMGNVKAGTCVDSVITSPDDNDFYLVSHGGLKGTSRPCHYHVLRDDLKFTADKLQARFRFRFGFRFRQAGPRAPRPLALPGAGLRAQPRVLPLHVCRLHPGAGLLRPPGGGARPRGVRRRRRQRLRVRCQLGVRRRRGVARPGGGAAALRRHALGLSSGGARVQRWPATADAVSGCGHRCNWAPRLR